MSENTAQNTAPPPGMKLIAWQGVGLFVPLGWELGKYQGDHIAGSLRVDAQERVAAQARWWIARRGMSVDLLLDQYRKGVLGEAGGHTQINAAAWLALPHRDDLDVRAYDAVTESKTGAASTHESLVFAHNKTDGRAVLLRFFVGADGAHHDVMRGMLAGLRVQGALEWRDWAVLEFAFRGPSNMRLEESRLACGVCAFHFRRGRQRLALRRYSAANAVMGTWSPTPETLDAWARVAYAAEFHDMKYAVEAQHVSRGEHRLVLRGRKRLLAPLEMSWLVPRHRRPPREIVVRWLAEENKIVCVESTSVEVMRAVGTTMAESAVFIDLMEKGGIGERFAAGLTGEAAPVGRERSLGALVRRGVKAVPSETIEQGVRRVSLAVPVKRKKLTRFFRALSAQPTDAEETHRLRLDLLGVLLWDSCANETPVRAHVELVRDRLRVTRREAEQSVVEYVRAMALRGVFELKMDEA